MSALGPLYPLKPDIQSSEAIFGYGPTRDICHLASSNNSGRYEAAHVTYDNRSGARRAKVLT